MKQYFKKSTVLFLFFSSLFFILIVGISLVSKQSTQAEDVSLIYITISSVILLLFINIYDIIAFWIGGKRREFFVKKLAGARLNTQIKESLLNFIMIILMAFLISMIFAVAISAASSVIRITVDAMISSLLIGTVLSLVFGWPMIRQGLRSTYRGHRL